MLLNEPVNDFDIYFKTKETVKKISQYYVDLFNQNNKKQTNGVGRKHHAWVLDGADVQEWKEDKKLLSSFAYDYQDIKYSEIKEWNYSEDNEITKNVLRVSGMLLNTPEDRIKIMINSDGISDNSDKIADDVEYDINEYLNALNSGDEIPSNDMYKKENKGKYEPIFLSSNAITLSDDIQIVIRFYGEPEDIHKNYDFIHTLNYWTFAKGVVLNQNALEAIITKELKYIGSKYPICSLFRTRKFIKRGWTINAGQYVKMAFQISQLDLTDIYVLEDQLVGVDSIYFLNFIDNLKNRCLKDENFVLTQDYLSTVIDKVFG